MSATPQYSIELLAPARNAEIGIQAIRHGADAVYIGADSHGARAAAGNSVEDIARLVDYAHRFGARVYVTINTIIFDKELAAVEQLIRRLYAVGVDALIVQDLAVLRMESPPIALHASTQCDIRTPQLARFYESLGFSQLVMPRECSLEQLGEMRRATSVPLEAFVHGALCVSYSGDCYASQVVSGRSANRGTCAQLCRLPYTLTDATGRVIAAGKHLLSLRDMNRMAHLSEMIAAGVSSFKIEGRLKDAAYVKNVVSAYDIALRRLGVKRTSHGVVERQFTPDVSLSFNRGFTSYFLTQKMPQGIASINSPKNVGVEIGRVAAVKGKNITLAKATALTNGDGLTYFNAAGRLCGIRVNRVDSPTRFAAAEAVSGLAVGATIYRNFDKRFDDTLSGDTANRLIPLSLRLRRAGQLLVLEEAGGVSATAEWADVQQAKSPQEEARRRVIGKLGNTIYQLESLTDELANEFVPASALTELRRAFVAAMDCHIQATHRFDYRRKEDAAATFPDRELTYHANVANRMAEKVYRAHGVSGPIEPALELQPSPKKPIVVMTTRHCLRREMGRCLKSPAGREWAEPLTLAAQGFSLDVKFDCVNCQMQLIKVN
jgi:putative protease